MSVRARFAGPSAALLSVVACSGDETIILADAPPAASYVVLDRRGNAISARVFAGGDAPTSIVRGEGSDTWVLAYERSVEALRLLPSEEGTLETVGVDAPLADAWPLPAPDRAWFLARDGRELSDGAGALDAVRASFRVRRPPCAAPPEIVSVGSVPQGGRQSVAVRAGSGVLFGFGPNEGRATRSRLFRASAERGIEEELTAELAVTASSARFREPLGFVDGGVSWIAWPAGTATTGLGRLDLYPVTEDGRLGPPTSTFGPLPAPAAQEAFDELAGATFDGRRTLVARDEGGGLWALDEASREWRLVKALGGDRVRCPDPFYSSLVLTVDGPGTGLVGVLGEQIVRYDLDAPQVIVAPLLPWTDASCENSTVRTRSGLELVVRDIPLEGPVKSEARLSWRRGDGPWSELEVSGSVLARAILAVGDEVWLSGARATLAQLDDEPSRPEVEPRLCRTVAISIRTSQLVDLGSHLFVGVAGSSAAFVALSKRP